MTSESKSLAQRVAERALNASRPRTAAGKFDPKTIEEIAELTDSNNHTEALIAGAKMLGATALVKKLTLLAKLHELEGHLPQPLSQYRNILGEAVDTLAKHSLKPEEYEEFHGAF